MNDLDGTNGRSPSRLISLAIAAIYVIRALVSGGLESALKTVLFCVIPLACIWFPEALGDYTGFFLFDSLTKESPPFLVWFLGWVVFLLPVIIAVIVWLEGVGPRDVLR